MSAILDAKTQELEITSCCMCGCRFAVPDIIMAERRENAGSVYCPNGHQIGWSESSADKLRKQLAEAERKLTTAKCETANERALREAAERETKRVRKRSGNAVRPCCHRTFKQLAAHMKTKHPNFRA